VPDAGWTPLGEPGSGGRITGLAISPYDSDRVLVGGDMLGVGLTTDGGATWQATTGFRSWEINDFTWADATTVWAGTLSGPYRSTDGGRTWTPQRDGLPTGDNPYSAPVQKVLIDPSAPSHLLALGGNQRLFKKAGTGALNYGRVYSSDDGGEHWTTRATIGTDFNVVDAVAGGASLGTVYAAVIGQGVFRSTDGGRSWTAVNAGLPQLQVRDLAIDPADPQRVWVALDHAAALADGAYAPGGIYRTTDGGATWTAANGGLPQNASATASKATAMLSVHRAADGRLYTADHGLLSQRRFVSTDGGASWTALTATVDRFYPASTAPFAWASSADGRRLVAGTTDTILGSADRGATWTDVGNTRTTAGWRGNGFSGLLGTRAAFDRSRPGVLLLTAFDAGNILRTGDGGATWTRPAASYDNYGGGYDVAAGPVSYAVLGQAGVFNGLAASSDGGAQWRVAAGGTLPARYATGANQGSVAIASADGRTAYAVLPDAGLYGTTDAGATWARVTVGASVRAVAARDGSVWVATDAGVKALAPDGTWALLDGSPRGLRRLVPAGNGLLGVGSSASGALSTGLWRLAGGAWTQLVTDKFVRDVAVDPSDPSTLAYVTNDDPYHDVSFATGVWVSRDGGATFTADNAGLAMTRALSVAFDPAVKGRLVIGTNGRGFWQRRLP
jgi:photosystem II stability/assembly factor-like uncharacterized protein